MRRTCALFLGLTLLTGSCSDSTLSGSGRVSVFLTDAPIDMTDVTAVNVTLSGVILHGADNDGNGDPKLALAAGDDTIVNLLDYRDGDVVLVADGEVPEGSYSRIRLLITAAELVRDDDGDPETDGIVEPIFQSSDKVDIPAPFSISAGEDLEITLDFDAALSVHVNAANGQHPFILHPVIHVMSID